MDSPSDCFAEIKYTLNNANVNPINISSVKGSLKKIIAKATGITTLILLAMEVDVAPEISVDFAIKKKVITKTKPNKNIGQNPGC
jgi:hypothetical protein